MNEKHRSHQNQIEPSLLKEDIDYDESYGHQKTFEAEHVATILEKLIHLSRFGNLLTLVVGDNGSGKTYLLNQLVNSMDESCQVCEIKAQPLLSIDQLFQKVIESFAGETTFTGIPLTANQYEEWAEQLSVVSGNRILIIDDAEVLSTSVLHELCQLSAMQQAKETPHLHLILFGNYDLSSMLEQAAQGILNEDGIYTIDIPELNEAESKQWLDYLFKKSGVVFLPDDEEIANMVIKGQGNIALLKEYVTEYSAISHEIKHQEAEDDPWKISAIGYWFAGFSILIISVLGIFFYQDELTELTGIGSKSQVQSKNKTVDELVISNADNKQAKSKQTIDAQEDGLEDDSLRENNLKDAQLKDVHLKDNQLSESNLTEDTLSQENKSSDDNPSIDHIVSVDQITEAVSLPKDQSGSEKGSSDQNDLKQSEVQTEPQQNLESETQSKSNLESQNESGLKAVLIADSEKQLESNSQIELSQTDVEPVTDEMNNLDKERVGESKTRMEKDLLSASDSEYVVQLIGLRKESSVKAFVNQYKMDNMQYYRSSLSGKPWYIVTLSGFSNKTAAQDAKTRLPEDLLKNGPWVKSIKAVKSDILKAQELFK